jgi:hypothetical protein
LLSAGDADEAARLRAPEESWSDEGVSETA